MRISQGRTTIKLAKSYHAQDMGGRVLLQYTAVLVGTVPGTSIGDNLARTRHQTIEQSKKRLDMTSILQGCRPQFVRITFLLDARTAALKVLGIVTIAFLVCGGGDQHSHPRAAAGAPDQSSLFYGRFRGGGLSDRLSYLGHAARLQAQDVRLHWLPRFFSKRTTTISADFGPGTCLSSNGRARVLRPTK